MRPVAFVLVLAFIATTLPVQPVHAAQLPTSLSIAAPPAASPATSIAVTGKLVLTAGQGFVLQPVDITMDGVVVASTRTNVLGDFNVNIALPPARGVVDLQAIWRQADQETRSGTARVVLADPPTPPASVAAAADHGHAPVTLSWGPPVDDGGAPVDRYSVYRKIGTGPRVVVAHLDGSARGWLDAGAPGGESIQYRVLVQTVRANATSPDVTVPMGPAAPRDLKALANATTQGVDLSWNAPSGSAPVSGYRVWRDGALYATLPATQRALADPALEPGIIYTYLVRAVNDIGEGAAAQVAFAPVPLAVSGFTASPVFIQNAIRFTWDAPDPRAGITQFRIDRWNGGTTWTGSVYAPGDATSAEAQQLAYDTAYTFRISAMNAGGWSPYAYASATTDIGPYRFQYGTPAAVVCPPPSGAVHSGAPPGCGFVSTDAQWAAGPGTEQRVGAWTEIYVNDVNGRHLINITFDAWAVTTIMGPCPTNGSSCSGALHTLRFDRNMTLTTGGFNGQILFTPQFSTFELPVGECWHVSFALRMTHPRASPDPTDDHASMRLCGSSA